MSGAKENAETEAGALKIFFCIRRSEFDSRVGKNARSSRSAVEVRTRAQNTLATTLLGMRAPV